MERGTRFRVEGLLQPNTEPERFYLTSDDASRQPKAGQHKRLSPDQPGQQPSPDQQSDQNRHQEAPAKEIPKDQPGYDQNETGDKSA